MAADRVTASHPVLVPLSASVVAELERGRTSICRPANLAPGALLTLEKAPGAAIHVF